MHGARTPRGPASPNWKHGRYSRTLPRRLLADAQASLSDADRLVLNEEIALIDARTSDLLQRVDSGESGHLWRELHAAWRAYETARRAGDAAGTEGALATVGETITRGHGDAAAWAEVRQLVQERRRVAESERKRLVEAQHLVAVESAWGLLASLVDAVRLHVRDDAALRAVAQEFARLTGQPADEGARWNA